MEATYFPLLMLKALSPLIVNIILSSKKQNRPVVISLGFDFFMPHIKLQKKRWPKVKIGATKLSKLGRILHLPTGVVEYAVTN
jgi:hypothetical protein